MRSNRKRKSIASKSAVARAAREGALSRSADATVTRRREVAAVDGRDIRRRQRRQRPGVMPVEQMSLEFLQSLDCRQRLVDPTEELRRVDELEVVGSEGREETEADVGRRRAVGDHPLGTDLDVVRRQEVVFGTDQLVEERPRGSRDRLQIATVSG